MPMAGDDAGALADGISRAEAGFMVTPRRKVSIRPHVIIDTAKHLT